MIAQDKNVPILFMLEEVEDAFFLHQPGNEVQIGLLVLDAILTLREVAGQAPREVVKSCGFEHLLDDLWSFLVLEDPGVCSQAEKPQPRNHFGLVGRKTGAAVPLSE